VLFDARSAVVQWGGLVTWQSDFGGSDNSSINLLAVQPFGMLQLGGGTYLRSVGIWTFNFFIEPQFTVLSSGAGQPDFQIFFGFNTQFKP